MPSGASGFKSHKSFCDGPPHRKMKMQCFAVAFGNVAVSAREASGSDKPSNPSELSRSSSRRLTQRSARCAETNEIMRCPKGKRIGLSSDSYGFVSDSRAELQVDGLKAQRSSVRFILWQRELTGRFLLDGDENSQTAADSKILSAHRRAEEAVKLEGLGLAERRAELGGSQFADRAGIFVDVLKSEQHEPAGHVREERLVEFIDR